jgi:thioredoxin 2
MADTVIVQCPKCGAKNRVPASRWDDPGAVCGKCKTHLNPSSLYPDRPVVVTDSTFRREVLDFQGPVVVEFFAPW